MTNAPEHDGGSQHTGDSHESDRGAANPGRRDFLRGALTAGSAVAIPGALLSAGDSHASQGDSELCGTAIECSLTRTFQLVLRKRDRPAGTALAGLNYPLLETQDEWVLHGFSYANYLAEQGADAQSRIYEKSSIDLAMKDAFRKMRHFLMTTKGLSEDEAISLMSVGVDFSITQVVDGNWACTPSSRRTSSRATRERAP